MNVMKRKSNPIGFIARFFDMVRLPLHNNSSPGVLMKSLYDRMPFLASTNAWDTVSIYIDPTHVVDVRKGIWSEKLLQYSSLTPLEREC